MGTYCWSNNPNYIRLDTVKMKYAELLILAKDKIKVAETEDNAWYIETLLTDAICLLDEAIKEVHDGQEYNEK